MSHRLIIALLAFWTIAGFVVGRYERNQQVWSGWIYPDRTNLKSAFQLGNFDSASSCRAAAMGLLAIASRSHDEDRDNPAGDYECGRACKPHPDHGASVRLCQETSH